MNVDDQIALTERLMLRVAPEIARYSLRFLEMQRSHLRTDEEEAELFTTMARRSAQLTLELAMHLAGAYARFKDETQDTAPAREQQTSAAAAPVRESRAGLPPSLSNLPSL